MIETDKRQCKRERRERDIYTYDRFFYVGLETNRQQEEYWRVREKRGGGQEQLLRAGKELRVQKSIKKKKRKEILKRNKERSKEGGAVRKRQ